MSDEGDVDASVATVTAPSASVPPPPRADAGVDASRPPVEGDAGIPGFDGGATEPVVVIELGAVVPGVPVSFVVPPNALGFHVTVESDRPSEELAVSAVTSPSGAVVHQEATPFGGSHPTSETLFGTTASVQVPQSEHPDVMPKVLAGTWQVTFRGSGNLRAKVQIQSTPDGEFHGGNLELDVYLPVGLRIGEGPPVTLANAATHREVRGRIDAFFANVQALFGLRNGSVRFHSIPSRFVTIEDRELEDVFRETRVAPKGQSLHVLLSQADDESEWWGIAAGIPGAANAPGNEQSGVALASMPEADAELEGVVLAHEAGHFFGLNHTTELRGQSDPLADTPICTNIDVGGLDRCPDVKNVMFVAGAVLGAPEASPSQRRVVQGSPIFKAFRAAPPNGIRQVPGALDVGKLFGHPGRPLLPVEVLAMRGMCRHPSHRAPALTRAQRADLASVANDVHVAARVRSAARRMVTGTP